ncbi:MAG: hypothetical protein KJ941_12915 [Bacteroidetes bacterium]|nr:hypothetical protein [Bacteroidota bacterium]
MHFKITLLFVFLVFVSCRKKPVDELENETTVTWEKGFVVLNEGLFQQNNSTLTKYTEGGVYQSEYFQKIAGKPLGDTGNDMQVYGNKIYIVVNVSSSIEVIDRITGKYIKQIPMLWNGQAKQPRYITFSGSKAYVSCFDGFVDVIDTSALTVSKRIKIGNNPEQMVVSNGNLFIANSGGLNFPNLDSTVSVINLVTEVETQKITVGLNPGALKITAEGRIIVHSRGDFSNVEGRLVEINSTNYQTTILPINNFKAFETFHNQLFIAREDINAIGIWDLNLNLYTMPAFIETQNLTTFYGIQHDAINQKIYVFDANGYVNTGKVIQYNESGSQGFVFNSGLIPNRIYEIK